MVRRRQARTASGVIAGAALAGLLLSPAGLGHAQSLEAALDRAYSTNPALAAGRRNRDAVGERVGQAFAGHLPQVSASAGVAAVNELTNTQEESFSASSDASLQVAQPIFRGGGTVAAVDQASFDLSAEEQAQLDREQTLLLDTASAYMDVWRDQGVVDLVEETRSLVAKQRDGVARQKELGQATATDLSLAESRLARIEADLIDAETQLAASSAGFFRLTGMKPGLLERPAIDDPLPESAAAAAAMALAGSPELRGADFQQSSALSGVDRAQAQFWPSLDLQGAVQYFSADFQDQANVVNDDFAVAQVQLRVTVPLFDGLLTTHQLREAKQSARAADLELADIERGVQIEARGAWTRMTGAADRRERLEQALQSAEQVLEGTQKEYQLGRRTLIDLLDAQQELLDLQTDLRSNRRDIDVAGFELQKAIGQFTAAALQLPSMVAAEQGVSGAD